MRALQDGPEPRGTRERVIRLLAREPLTASSLARELDVTVNAVRAQLALLQREGYIVSERKPGFRGDWLAVGMPGKA